MEICIQWSKRLGSWSAIKSTEIKPFRLKIEDNSKKKKLFASRNLEFLGRKIQFESRNITRRKKVWKITLESEKKNLLFSMKMWVNFFLSNQTPFTTSALKSNFLCVRTVTQGISRNWFFILSFLFLSTMGYFSLKNTYTLHTDWSEGFLYKVAPPELEISPSMYFSMYNLVV